MPGLVLYLRIPPRPFHAEFFEQKPAKALCALLIVHTSRTDSQETPSPAHMVCYCEWCPTREPIAWRKALTLSEQSDSTQSSAGGDNLLNQTPAAWENKTI